MKTVKSKSIRVSASQESVLVEGCIHKLSRSSMGWCHDDRVSPTDAVRIYSPATIKSLMKQGLLDSNFTDERGVGKCMDLHGVENIDGARHALSPEVPEFMVWTSALGRKVLGDKGVIPEQECNLYH